MQIMECWLCTVSCTQRVSHYFPAPPWRCGLEFLICPQLTWGSAYRVQLLESTKYLWGLLIQLLLLLDHSENENVSAVPAKKKNKNEKITSKPAWAPIGAACKSEPASLISYLTFTRRVYDYSRGTAERRSCGQINIAFSGLPAALTDEVTYI